MMLYKVTDENGQTRNQTQWGENISHTATGTGTELCSDGVIHAYENPLVAAFIHPLHVQFNNPILWEAEGEVIVREGQLKCGCKTLTTLKKISLPEISTEQRIEIAIRCAQLACKEPAWNEWASKWLSGEDRSKESANAAYRAAAAAYAANAAYAAFAAGAGAYFADAAYYADADADAAAAAYAASAARAAAWGVEFDLAEIIEKVLEGSSAL